MNEIKLKIKSGDNSVEITEGIVSFITINGESSVFETRDGVQRVGITLLYDADVLGVLERLYDESDTVKLYVNDQLNDVYVMENKPAIVGNSIFMRLKADK